MFVRQLHCRPSHLLRHPLSSRSLATHSTSTPLPSTTDSARVPPYEKLLAKYDELKKIFDRPLSLAEKILYSHLVDTNDAAQMKKGRGDAYLKLSPDRVAMQGGLLYGTLADIFLVSSARRRQYSV
jgi:homoaconitase